MTDTIHMTRDVWIPCSQFRPKKNVEVRTKFHDSNGDRQRVDMLWDGTGWRYGGVSITSDRFYVPTHWRPL